VRTYPILAGAILTLVAAATPAPPIPGTFALQSRTASAMGYLLAPQIGNNSLHRHLDVWMTPIGSAAAIRSYRIDMTKLLHMIIVSDDFSTFLHVHPILQPDGHFLLEQEFPSPGLYHVYADAEPQGFGHQVFRFDLDLGGSTRATRDLSERGTISRTGPYVVRISTDKLSTQMPTRLVVHILEGGIPAADLHPYLGALAHAVFLNAGNLTYVHAHPMPLSAQHSLRGSASTGETVMKPLPASSISSPDMQLNVKLQQPGIYKLWLQFRGGTQLYVAPFIVTARDGG
jgi:hypothetical protein